MGVTPLGVGFLTATFLIATAAFGNGLAGVRLEKVVDNQIVDVGTDQASTPQAGSPIQFDFNLLKSDTRAVLPATNVNVAISRRGVQLLDNDLLVEPPLTLCVLTFPEEGEYSLKVTFYDHDRQLATATFPLVIGGTATKTRAIYGGALFGSLALGLLGGYWAGRRRRI